MKYLGIDYGKKRVGLAISEGKMAEALRVLEVSSLADAIEKVLHVVSKEEIDVVVVGMPESGEAHNMTRAFIRGMKERGVKVFSVEETLSTRLADERVRELGLNKQRQDAIAAAAILQNYLDRLK